METSISIDKETKSWYVEYYRKTGNMRNDLLRNSEVTFQLFANENALLKSLRKAECKCGIWSVLDVGCGSGAGLLNFLRFGFIGENLHGIDLQVERAELARKRLPMCRIVQGDAAKMGYADSSFDLVFESTMFVQITDETLASGIANEMVRVCKPGGYIILSDWRYSKPFNRAYRGLDKARIKRLFQV
jgi:ubiquinone/menaquinone biosynthesis C-methylase UbiE